MWADEREAGVALRTLQEEPAPPLATTLEQVVRRGRRRVRVQRLGVLAVVVVVLAAVGGGALVLWGPRRQPEPSAAELMTVYQWPENLPGWSVVETGSCGPGVGRTGSVPLLPRETVEPVFVNAVTEVTGDPANLTASSWIQPLRGYSEVEVPVEKAFGSVQLEAMITPGPPVAVANADIGVYGFCSAPLRKVLDTGTVLQLYEPDARSPFAPVQHLRTYLPNGRLYVVSSAGWSRADYQDDVVLRGRGRLPLDSQQLADVAIRLADLG